MTKTDSIYKDLEMRQWQRAAACIVILTVFCLVIGCPARGHGGDITLAELWEQPEAQYQLRVDLPNALAGSLLTPQLPARCRLLPAVALPQARPTILQFAFTCDEHPLLGGDTLGLPWPTAGGVVTAYWQDGSSQSQFFTAEADGVTVPLDRLQSTDETWVPQLRQDAISGVRHVFVAWPHLLFLVSLAFWARAQRLVHFITAFMLGSLLSVAIALVSGATVSLVVAETGLSMAAAILALLGVLKNQARLPNWSAVLLVALGLLHGLGWAEVLSEGSVVGVQLGMRLLVVNVGMDAAQLLVALAITGGMRLRRRFSQSGRWRKGVGYSLVGLAIVAIGLPQTYQGQALSGLRRSSRPTTVQPNRGETTAGISNPTPTITTQPRIAASQLPDPQSENSETLTTPAPNGDRPLPIQGFLTIEPLETRYEILLEVSPLLASGLVENSPSPPTLAVEDQEPFQQQVAQALINRLRLQIDDTVVEPSLDQVNFVSVGETGILNREEPTPEALDEAKLGIVLRHPTPDLPQTIAIEWTIFSPTVQRIATTISDPQRSVEQILTPAQPIARWQNTLVNVAAPAIEAIGVNATSRTIPIASLALIVGAFCLDRWVLKPKRQQRFWFAATRTVLPLAIWAYPIASLPLALPPPFEPQPSSTQVALILEQLLSNIYHAFEFRTEAEIYDKLAISVAGEQLTDIYLESRRALEVENRGGASARVDQVDVTEISSVHSLPDKQLLVQAEWLVGGAVTHFGHTHYRHNLYVASIALTYVDSVWKIKRIDVIDEHRLL